MLLSDFVLLPAALVPTVFYLAQKEQGTMAEKIISMPKGESWTTNDTLVGLACLLLMVASGLHIICMVYIGFRIPKIDRHKLQYEITKRQLKKSRGRAPYRIDAPAAGYRPTPARAVAPQPTTNNTYVPPGAGIIPYYA